MSVIPFRDFEFGKASAELESAFLPRLLTEGFLDFDDTRKRIKDDAECLVLGYKGSGKSAIAEHLRLRAQGEPLLFVSHRFLSDFPFGSFARIVTGDASPESRYPTAWSWILYLNLIDSFSQDMGSPTNLSREFQDSCRALRSVGLLPAQDLKQLVIASSKPKFRATLPPLLDIEYDPNSVPGNDLKFLHLVNRLKSVAQGFRGESRHLLIIDGLDDVLTTQKVQYQSLAALVTETVRLNQELRQAGTPAKVVVLCRTDLFEKLPSPNKNKMRQDLAIELDWYHDPRRPRLSRLVTLANLRAKLASPLLTDLFEEYIPAKLPPGDRATLQFMLDHTRHTPRDFLQLLVHLQRYARSHPLTRDEVFSGLRYYSINYFLPEIRDELEGYVAHHEFDAFLKAVGRLDKRQFSTKELRSELFQTSDASEREIQRLLEVLFECSAIGNVRKKPSGAVLFSFKYRNRTSTLSAREDICLHRGLWKALNLV